MLLVNLLVVEAGVVVIFVAEALAARLRLVDRHVVEYVIEVGVVLLLFHGFIAYSDGIFEDSEYVPVLNCRG